MVVKVSKPEFNLRSKINELDYGHVPYEKMPAGSIIQVKKLSGKGAGSLSQTNTSYAALAHMAISFTPRFSNSLIRIDATQQYWFAAADSNNYSVWTVYRDGTYNLAARGYNDNYTGTSTSQGVYFSAQRPAATYNHTAAFTLWDKPCTTESITYQIYNRLYSAGTMYTRWDGHHDSFSITEIRQ
jgi:hypothetical protein